MLSDHHLFFGDTAFTRSFLPVVDGVLDYFERHIDELGLVSGVEWEIWQYVDWVKDWAPGPNDGDKGVPPSGRESNRYTFFSLLYVYTLRQAATLLERVGRRGLVDEYRQRADRTAQAAKRHCFDGELYTDSTVEASRAAGSHSWHCQIFAVLAEIEIGPDAKRLLEPSRAKDDISVCSYAMRFYEFRAYAKADLYHSIHRTMFDPWRKMLSNGMTTWAEDDIRQRSDCHAWSAVPLYEFFVEIAGLSPVEAGCKTISFKPRVDLRESINGKCCLGQIFAEVEWHKMEAGGTTKIEIELRLSTAVRVMSQLPGGVEEDHGVVDRLQLAWRGR
jgi:hypothetical protein